MNGAVPGVTALGTEPNMEAGTTVGPVVTPAAVKNCTSAVPALLHATAYATEPSFATAILGFRPAGRLTMAPGRPVAEKVCTWIVLGTPAAAASDQTTTKPP